MSLTVSIARSSPLPTTPLVLSGTADANQLGITNYMEPARQARIAYAPDSAWVHGSQALAWAWQQTLLQFDVVTDLAASETASRNLLTDLRNAITQWKFNVTVTIGGAAGEVWACQPGSIAPAGGRTYADIENHDPIWSVSIPCYPIPS